MSSRTAANSSSGSGSSSRPRGRESERGNESQWWKKPPLEQRAYNGNNHRVSERRLTDWSPRGPNGMRFGGAAWWRPARRAAPLRATPRRFGARAAPLSPPRYCSPCVRLFSRSPALAPSSFCFCYPPRLLFVALARTPPLLPLPSSTLLRSLVDANQVVSVRRVARSLVLSRFSGFPFLCRSGGRSFRVAVARQRTGRRAAAAAVAAAGSLARHAPFRAYVPPSSSDTHAKARALPDTALPDYHHRGTATTRQRRPRSRPRPRPRLRLRFWLLCAATLSSTYASSS